MKSYEGEPKALMFFIAYTKNGVDDLGKRPITFAFNGGPGSSSVWLHLGMLGPKRVKIPDDASAVPPPYGLSSNPYSLLDITDLVFIDPVSTGFSRPAEGEEKEQFHGYEEDLRSVGQFIHDYVTKYGRWRSPKFLVRRKLRRLALGRPLGPLARALQHGAQRHRDDLAGDQLLDAWFSTRQRPAVHPVRSELRRHGLVSQGAARRLAAAAAGRRCTSRPTNLPETNTRWR